jgi:YVTN family beta-propeller protein
VGAYPESIAFDPSNGFLYVTNHVYGAVSSADCQYASGLSTVTVFSGSNDTIMATLVVGKAAAGIAFDSVTNRIYVANCGSNNVSVINSVTNTIAGSFGVGTAPMGVAWISNGNLVAIANSGSNNVSYVSGTTVLRSVAVGTDPQFLVYNPAAVSLYVTDSGSDNVTVIAANTYARSSIGVGTEPEGIAYNPVLKHVYTANFGSSNVSIIYDLTVYASPAVGLEPWGVAYDAGSNAVYVTNANPENVSVLQNDRIVGSVEPFTNQPYYQLSLYGMVYDSITGDLYFADQGTNPGQALVLAGAFGLPGVGATLGPIAGSPLGGAVDASGTLYLPNEAGSNLTLLSHPGEVGVRPTSVRVGLHPHAVVFDPVRGEVYVANTGSNNVSVVSTTTMSVVAWVSVGVSPEAIAYDPTNNQIDVANFGDGTMSVISDSSNIVVATVAVGIGPSGIAVSDGFVFVVNSGSDSMMEIDGSNNSVVASFGTGINPQAIAIDHGVGYIANLGSDNVTEFSCGAPTVRSYSTVPAGGTFDGIAASDGYVYVAEPSIKQIAVLSEPLAQPSGGLYGTVGWIHTASAPQTVTFDTFTGDLYVAFGSASKSLSAIVTRSDAIETVLTTSGTGGTTSAAFAAYNGDIYVTESNVNKLAVYSPWVATPKLISVGTFPLDAVYDSAHFFVYVANEASHNVSIVNAVTNFVVHTQAVGTDPTGEAYDSGSGDVFVANYGSNNVSVLNGQTLKYTLAVGVHPIGVAYDPVTQLVYVANAGGTNLTVISGGAVPAVVGSIQVGSAPFDITVDPTTGDLYLDHQTLDNVTVLTPAGVHSSILLPMQSLGGLVWDNGTARLFVCGLTPGGVFGEVAVLAEGNLVRTFNWRDTGNQNGAWDPLTGDIYLPEAQYLDVAVVGTGL